MEKTGTGVKFDFGSEAIPAGSEAEQAVNSFVEGWKRNGGSRPVTVEGFASTDGAFDYNLGLSCRRALSVKAELEKRFVHSSLITTIARGETSAFDDSNLVENRRVLIKEQLPAPSQQDPKFSIKGKVEARANKNPAPTAATSTLRTVFLLGDFDIKAEVDVQAAQASDLDDWQAGIVQTVAFPLDRACYRFPAGSAPPGHPHANEVFVQELDAPAPLHPDRDKASPLWMNLGSGENLETVHQGRTAFSRIHKAEDHPSNKTPNSLFVVTQDANDSRAQLFRMQRFGFMITHVIARQMSSGRVLPLHTVEWLIVAIANISPSPGMGFPPDVDVLTHRFEIRDNRPFSSRDLPPKIEGTNINLLPQKGGWRSLCPPF